MSERQIGRALASGLHQAITELLPTRAEFYESWVTPSRIRQGELGRARIAAVISFLRQEGPAYQAVMDRAGRCIADWTLDTLGARRRALLRRLPRPLRLRAVLRVADRVVRGLHTEVRLDGRVRGPVAVVTVEGSLFCSVREPASAPLCQFYGALIEQCLAAFELPARAELARCRGTGDPTCEIIVDTSEDAGSRDAPPGTAAA